MHAMTSINLTAIFVLGLSLVLMPCDAARAGITAGPAEPTTITPKEDKAPKPAKAAPRPSAAPAGRVMKLDKQTVKKLDRLPANQKILVKGKEMSVGQYKRELVKEQKQSINKVKAMPSPAPPSTEALQKELDQKDEARLRAANAKVKAEMAKLGKRPAAAPSSAAADAIKREAGEIQERMRAGNGTPADEARAKELWEQYQALK